MNDRVKNLVEVILNNDEDFLKVKETLTRIGISSKKDNTLYQSCHILHKKGKFYIVHFKELFQLDGKPTNYDESDIARRNTIVNLLQEWGLVTIVDPNKTQYPVAPLNQVKVISYKEKPEWNLTSKYKIGR